jgi:hypothetical protein
VYEDKKFRLSVRLYPGSLEKYYGAQFGARQLIT